MASEKTSAEKEFVEATSKSPERTVGDVVKEVTERTAKKASESRLKEAAEKPKKRKAIEEPKAAEKKKKKKSSEMTVAEVAAAAAEKRKSAEAEKAAAASSSSTESSGDETSSKGYSDSSRSSQGKQQGSGSGGRQWEVDIPGWDTASNIPSRCTPESVDTFFSTLLRLPAGYSVRCPGEDDRVCSPREGEVGVYMKNFDQGLRFPVEPFLVEVLNFLEVSIAQLYPNALANLTAFSALCKECKVEPTLRLFRYFFTRKETSDAGYLSLCGRRNRVLIVELPTSIKEWKSSFVFVKGPEPFPFRTSWGHIPVKTGKDVTLTEDEEVVVATLSSVPRGERVAIVLVGKYP